MWYIINMNKDEVYLIPQSTLSKIELSFWCVDGVPENWVDVLKTDRQTPHVEVNMTLNVCKRKVKNYSSLLKRTRWNFTWLVVR